MGWTGNGDERRNRRIVERMGGMVRRGKEGRNAGKVGKGGCQPGRRAGRQLLATCVCTREQVSAVGVVRSLMSV